MKQVAFTLKLAMMWTMDLGTLLHHAENTRCLGPIQALKQNFEYTSTQRLVLFMMSIHHICGNEIQIRSRRMFWELAPEDVIGELTDLSCANAEREWKRRKHKMEKASRWSWTEHENSTRTMHLREYTLREFWEIFVDDGPFGADAFFRHVNVQNKPYSPMHGRQWMRSMDGRMKRKGWDPNSQHARGSTPKKR